MFEVQREDVSGAFDPESSLQVHRQSWINDRPERGRTDKDISPALAYMGQTGPITNEPTVSCEELVNKVEDDREDSPSFVKNPKGHSSDFELSATHILGLSILLHISCPRIQSLSVRRLPTKPLSRDQPEALATIASSFYWLLPLSLRQYYAQLGVAHHASYYTSMVDIWPEHCARNSENPLFSFHVCHFSNLPDACISMIRPPRMAPVAARTLRLRAFGSLKGFDPRCLHNFLLTEAAEIETLIIEEFESLLAFLSLKPFHLSNDLRQPRPKFKLGTRLFDDDFSQYTSLLPSIRHIILIYPDGASWLPDDVHWEIKRVFKARNLMGNGIETFRVHASEEMELPMLGPLREYVGSIHRCKNLDELLQ